MLENKRAETEAGAEAARRKRDEEDAEEDRLEVGATGIEGFTLQTREDRKRQAYKHRFHVDVTREHECLPNSRMRIR